MIDTAPTSKRVSQSLHATRPRHVHVDAFDLAGCLNKRERPIVPGQTDAKNSVSYNCVEARRCLRVGSANEGGQEHVGEKARSKSDGTL
jgi:hypothetical protein